MTFHYEFAFWLLFLLIPIFYYFYKPPYQQKIIRNPIFKLLREYNKKNHISKIVLITKKILIVLITIFIVIIIARPQEGYEEEKNSQKGIDIMLALDISESMLADDLKPNRINAAKNVIIDFIKKLSADRLGIVVFAGKPFTQSPLTFDYNIVSQYVEELSTDSINQNVRGLSGTAIGDAILSSITKLEKEEERSKVIILLTDGEANTGVDPITASKLAKDKNIKIYTIGIGQKEGYPLKYTDNFGQTRNYTDMFGNLVMTYLDETTLKAIAQETGGQYFIASNNQALDAIFSEIDKLEKKEIETMNIKKYRENYTGYAFFTIMLLFTYIMLDYIKPKFS